MRAAISLLLGLLATDLLAATSPCYRSPRATPVFAVTASAIPGMMHVHYEALVAFPVEGPPVASVSGTELAITQFGVAVGYDPVPGMPPYLCQAEDLDIPALAPGRYRGSWMYTTPPWYGGGSVPVWGFRVEFDVTDPPQLPCAAAAAPLAYIRDTQLFFSDLVTLQPATFAPPEVEVSGNTITVTERYDVDDNSLGFETRCHSATASLPFAPQPGARYDVVWIYKGPLGQM